MAAAALNGVCTAVGAAPSGRRQLPSLPHCAPLVQAMRFQESAPIKISAFALFPDHIMLCSHGLPAPQFCRGRRFVCLPVPHRCSDGLPVGNQPDCACIFVWDVGGGCDVRICSGSGGQWRRQGVSLLSHAQQAGVLSPRPAQQGRSMVSPHHN